MEPIKWPEVEWLTPEVDPRDLHLEEPRVGDMKVGEFGATLIYAGKAGWRRVVEPQSDITSLLLEAIRQCETWKREEEDYYDVGYNEAISNCCRILKKLIKEKTSE